MPKKSTRFDSFLGNANDAQSKQPLTDASDTRTEFWDSMKVEEPVPMIRLSVSVPVDLDAKIKAKADELRISKNELINKMLDYLLE